MTETFLADEELRALALKAGNVFAQAGHCIVTAESCTGGGIMKTLTDIPGSSQWCEGGFITYTNRAKHHFLGVPEVLFEQVGAVSEEVVRAMASGALAHSAGTLSVAVSGVAGPGGGSPEKPVGTVWIAWAKNDGVVTKCFLFSGERDAVRRQTVDAAIRGLMALC
ncbi:CinA family protein [Sansalvadorimonas verongulae]|uniref:CinA family protein n=1 Tax=Sansalvadorimonas verongulae TaxID=2172824 RepID=UPI0012BC7021|nr:CinA family protein [Sansalvadorimonas verongulae]MTI12920.1 CinA family protein [Sansalvadorimonas verongulae]